MESAVQKLLESATHRTLHANGLSRTSTQASAVLTDILSRYLTLLASTCVRYTQHAERTHSTAWDAISALEEVGISLHELAEYYTSEGIELGRYALYSARRAEDLNEFRAQFIDGLRQDRDDSIELYYAPMLPGYMEEDEDEDEDEAGEDGRIVDVVMASTPVSYPRHLPWRPPPHIPDFLPPFPTVTEDLSPPPTAPHSPTPHLNFEQPTVLPMVDKPVLPPSQPITSSAASDYLVRVPYSQSSLSAIPERHLPSSPPSPLAPPRQPRFPTPQIEPALIGAYHHILTHPPPPNNNPPNPSRHKVAMALFSQSQTKPRWDPPDTLYSSIAPCPPRAASIAPTYPIAIGDLVGTDSKGKDVKFPPAISRPVAAPERLTPLISQQPSRIPDLARHVLPPSILGRTSRLTHPPVLYRGSKPLVYGPGVPAPWNANALPTPDIAHSTSLKDDKGDTPARPVIPDARLFATWDYEPKDFKTPMIKARGRVGSMPGGTISLAVGSRGKGKAG
ncbi:hypothetical protein BD779DRAFT_1670390 [Infundibulicybe gibba]|nr:hypothetical protein BD779DRAFT_1670390 [Infundibulicybe gibba]